MYIVVECYVNITEKKVFASFIQFCKEYRIRENTIRVIIAQSQSIGLSCDNEIYYKLHSIFYNLKLFGFVHDYCLSKMEIGILFVAMNLFSGSILRLCVGSTIIIVRLKRIEKCRHNFACSALSPYLGRIINFIYKCKAG